VTLPGGNGYIGWKMREPLFIRRRKWSSMLGLLLEGPDSPTKAVQSTILELRGTAPGNPTIEADTAMGEVTRRRREASKIEVRNRIRVRVVQPFTGASCLTR